MHISQSILYIIESILYKQIILYSCNKIRLFKMRYLKRLFQKIHLWVLEQILWFIVQGTLFCDLISSQTRTKNLLPEFPSFKRHKPSKLHKRGEIFQNFKKNVFSHMLKILKNATKEKQRRVNPFKFIVIAFPPTTLPKNSPSQNPLYRHLVTVGLNRQ